MFYWFHKKKKKRVYFNGLVFPKLDTKNIFKHIILMLSQIEVLRS